MRSADTLSRLRQLGFEEVTTTPLSFGRAPAPGVGVEVAGARPALGTLVVVRAAVPSADQGEAAIGEAFAELDRLTAIFSRYEPASAVSALNDAGRLAGPPPELVHVTGRALELHAATRGAFDVTVKPVLDLLAARFPFRPPSDGEVRDAAALVGADRLDCGRRRIRLARAGMGVTLDGIAKGYIVDRMAAALERRGLRRWLIDAGGDIRVRGLNGRGAPWRIAVRDPAGGPAFPDVIALRGGAVATSGGYARYYDAEHRYHHIVTPGTGHSPRDVASASVVAPDALTADALATAVFVLGAVLGLPLVERLPGCAALVVASNGTPHRSRRWQALAVERQEGTLL